MNPSSDELIENIHRDNRRFKFAQTLFVVLVVIGMFIVVIVFNRGFQAAQRHSDEQLAKQTAYIQCLAKFFATKDRANLTLDDLDKCNFNRDGEVINGVDLTPSKQQNFSTPLTPPEQKRPITVPTNGGGSMASPQQPAVTSGNSGGQSTSPELPIVPNVLKVISKPACGLPADLCIAN